MFDWKCWLIHILWLEVRDFRRHTCLGKSSIFISNGYFIIIFSIILVN